MAISIRVPSSLSLADSIQFCSELRNLPPDNEYRFDFKETRLIEPFGMLLVSSELQRCITARPDAKVYCVSYEHMTYAGHMGFFRAFGLEYGKWPGQAAGSRNYIPLTIMSAPQIVQDAARKGLEVGDEIEDRCGRLSETLSGSAEGDLFETLRFSMRELMRNVIEHSEASQFGFCAQYWPSKGSAEVAIIDRGIGLQASLRNNPHVDASDHKRAINYALMPAVSGKTFKGSPRPRQRSPWNNSGFGLYMTSRICRNGGNFFVGTGDTGMLLTAGKGGKRYYQLVHEGTAIRMRIDTKQITGLRESLARYREEGYLIQQRYKEIVNIDPSSASLMLSEDFDLSVWERLLNKLRS